MGSERTAAAEGALGERRRDPFAMLPFCGYNMADYWQHWLDMGELLGDRAPRIYGVNWFRRGPDGRFLWPGFGDNSRVIDWISQRLSGAAAGQKTPLGIIPAPGELNLAGTDVSADDLTELFRIDPAAWAAETADAGRYFEQFGDRLPAALERRRRALQDEFGHAAQAVASVG